MVIYAERLSDNAPFTIIRDGKGFKPVPLQGIDVLIFERGSGTSQVVQQKVGNSKNEILIGYLQADDSSFSIIRGKEI